MWKAGDQCNCQLSSSNLSSNHNELELSNKSGSFICDESRKSLLQDSSKAEKQEMTLSLADAN